MLPKPVRRSKLNIWSWMAAILLPLIIATPLSWFLIPQPIIGVIHLNDSIYSVSAQDMITQIAYARQHPEIRAVVLVINSPGGTVVDTESVYLELALLRKEKPVITVVEGMAASGAYYLSVGTDYIFAKPSSIVGNIGIIGILPTNPTVYEDYYSTGPYKMTGSTRDTYVREMEMLKQAFWEAVKLGRGSSLTAPQEVILSGQIWLGSEALKIGIIDAIGTQTEAYEKAAEMAKIAHYKVEDLRSLAGLPEITSSSFYYQLPDGRITPYPNKEGLYFLYIPPQEAGQ